MTSIAIPFSRTGKATTSGSGKISQVVILRVFDFFDVVKNRGCKQNSYDDKLVINSKKSQTLSAVTLRVAKKLWSRGACPERSRGDPYNLLESQVQESCIAPSSRRTRYFLNCFSSCSPLRAGRYRSPARASAAYTALASGIFSSSFRCCLTTSASPRTIGPLNAPAGPSSA